MKIDGNRPVVPGAVRRDTKSTSGSNFAGNLPIVEGEEHTAAPVSNTQALGAMEALFALQEVPDATAKRKRALARGDRMLERLDDLRLGLLLGHVGRNKLAELAHLAREGTRDLDDPNLKQILEEIELRAEVELAKLQESSEG